MKKILTGKPLNSYLQAHLMLKILLTLGFFCCGINLAISQLADGNQLWVESSYRHYKKDSRLHPEKQMVELKRSSPELVYDLRYATRNNFMQRLMYPAGTSSAFLRKPAADALSQVQQELAKQGYGLKIFDAYRPYAVSKKFWELVKDERYVANPAKGSNHNRGTAVDLTLIHLKTGEELDMGTGFDNFTDSAHHTFLQLPAEVLSNRKKLRSVMERYGFSALSTEWWHYSFQSKMDYTLLDIPFKKLKR